MLIYQGSIIYLFCFINYLLSILFSYYFKIWSKEILKGVNIEFLFENQDFILTLQIFIYLVS